MVENTMTDVQVTILLLYGVIVVVGPIRLSVLEIILRRQQPLTLESPCYALTDPPLVTAILPAKDEEKYVGECLRSICRQTYPNLEILVVDDRSTDQTGAIARGIAATDARVRVLTIDELPPGWTGKTHALERASHSARGEWLLFVDADTLHAPESLSIMMEFARVHGSALASILPDLRCETFWEHVVQPLAAITLMQSFPLGAVNNARSPLAFANGQYILVERAAYDAAGGHREVRDRFVEDIALAQRLKAIGYPIRIALVRGVVSCRMYSSFQQVVRGWSRIFYDALDRDRWRIGKKLLDPLIFCQTGHLALVLSLVLLIWAGGRPFVWVLLALSVFHHFFMYLVFRRVYEASTSGTRWAPFFAIANAVVDLILLRSLWMCVTGKVMWRGTAYGSAGIPAGNMPVADDKAARPQGDLRR
jgi:glycosyltransferase involved in cell wall biosynthesis